MDDKYPIGIDLGTTFCSVNVWVNGRNESVPNAVGEKTTSSTISFHDGNRVFGSSALSHLVKNPESVIYDSKRMIGREYTEVQDELKHYGFIVRPGEKNKPVFKVPKGGVPLEKGQDIDSVETDEYYPEEVSGMLLSHMKDIAAKFLGYEPESAVITVPAHFNDSQRTATEAAAKIAGLDVLQLLDEPTAAAIAYGIGNEDENERNILVFDLGGGTFDVSVVRVEGRDFRVLGTEGDTRLGGQDFDQRLMDFCFEEFVKQGGSTKARENAKARAKLRKECTRAKIELSATLSVTIDIDNLYKGVDLSIDVSRAKFEDLCKTEFQKCIPSLDAVLRNTRLAKGDISDIVMVGGSTRIPYIQEMVKEYFDSRVLKNDLDPNLAISTGALASALNAAGQEPEFVDEIAVRDVTRLTFGVATQGGVMESVIPKGSTIPISRSKEFATTRDEQTGFDIQVFEGENKRVTDNHFLGHFKIDGAEALPRGQAVVKVTFSVDRSGILTVEAEETTKNIKKQLDVNTHKRDFDEERINEMIERAEAQREQDKAFHAHVTAMNHLEEVCYRIKDKAVSQDDLTDDALGQLEELVQEAFEWLNGDECAASEPEDIRRYAKDVEDRANAILES